LTTINLVCAPAFSEVNHVPAKTGTHAEAGIHSYNMNPFLQQEFIVEAGIHEFRLLWKELAKSKKLFIP